MALNFLRSIQSNDLESRIFFTIVAVVPFLVLVATAPPEVSSGWKEKKGHIPGISNVVFYIAVNLTVWLTCRCLTPPRFSTTSLGSQQQLKRQEEEEKEGVRETKEGREEGVVSGGLEEGGNSLRIDERWERAQNVRDRKGKIQKRTEGEISEDEQTEEEKAVKPKDTVHFITHLGVLGVFKLVVYTLGFYHALLGLFFPSSDNSSRHEGGGGIQNDLTSHSPISKLCPHHQALNPQLFSLSPLSPLPPQHTGSTLTHVPFLYPIIHLPITHLTLTLISSLLRLLAFHHLRENFTFHLSRPSKLVTTGLYRYIQHPSYTFLFTLAASFAALLGAREPRDGVLGCFLVDVDDVIFGMREGGGGLEGGNLVVLIVEGIVYWVVKWWNVLYWSTLLIGLVGAGFRVRDEERVLKETFGREWEVWRRGRARFIPWVV